MHRPSRLLPLLLTAAALFYLIFIARTAFRAEDKLYFTLVDDAMISMRYARNLAEGQGLVWNPGQPPVEGFTNLGWTLLLSAIHLFPFSSASISLVVMLLAAGLLLANQVVVFRIIQALDPQAQYAPLIGATATAFYFPLVFWTLRGLEVGALLVCINLALLLVLRLADQASAPSQAEAGTAIWLPILLASAILIRLDAIIPASLLLLYLGIKAPHKAWVPCLAAILMLAAVLIFQKLYYGDFLPNTYYLKVNGVTAWERIRAGLLSLSQYAAHDFLMLLFVGSLGLVLYRDLRRPEIAGLLVVFLTQVAYSIWIGGDYAEDLVNSANRFITQGMPALIILMSLTVEQLIRQVPDLRLAPAYSLAIGLGAAIVMSGTSWVQWTLTNAPMLRTDIQRVRLGLHIERYTRPEAVIAVHAAGQIPYFSDRTYIDLLGKNDPVIAKGPPATAFAPGHNKWNYKYSILQLRPDVVADNFNKLRAYMADQADYELLPNGIYARKDSQLIDWPGLGSDYR